MSGTWIPSIFSFSLLLTEFTKGFRLALLSFPHITCAPRF